MEQKESVVGWSPLSMMVAATPPHRVQPEMTWVSKYIQFVRTDEMEMLIYKISPVLCGQGTMSTVPTGHN